MQMLGGASDSVPTVSTPGVASRNVPGLIEPRGTTDGVVYLSSPGPFAAAARLVGSALALCSPGGAHWSPSAPARGADPMPNTKSATSAVTIVLPIRAIVKT